MSSLSATNYRVARGYCLSGSLVDARHQTARLHPSAKCFALGRTIEDSQHIEQIAINALKLEHKFSGWDLEDGQASQCCLNEANLFSCESSCPLIYTNRSICVVDDQFGSTKKRLDGPGFLLFEFDPSSNEIALGRGGLPVRDPSRTKDCGNRANRLNPRGKLFVGLQPSLQWSPPSDDRDCSRDRGPYSKHRKPVHLHLHSLEEEVSLLRIELRLQRSDDARDVGAERAGPAIRHARMVP